MNSSDKNPVDYYLVIIDAFRTCYIFKIIIRS